MSNTQRRFTITSKIMLGNLFIVLLLSICVIAVSARITSMQKEINYIVNHDILVHDTVNQMQKGIFNMESGQRGYIITGNESYLTQYSEGNMQWVDNYNKLHDELIANNPNQQSNLEQIKLVIKSWITEVGDPTIVMKKQKKSDELTQFLIADPGRKYIDQMRNQFDVFLTNEKQATAARAANMDQKNNLLKDLLYLVLVIISIISISLALFISNAIVRTLKQVVKSISEIGSSRGDYSKRIKITTRDEISDLGRATNGLLDNLEKYIWLQSKIAEVAGMYQAAASLDHLAQMFIDKVSTLIQASYGVVYIRDAEDSEKLVKLASYAAYGDHNAVECFRMGEGLVGQAALEKRTIVLEDLPEHYFQIASGLGHVSPKCVYIIPVIFLNKVEAVIEFAALKTFDLLQKALVERVQENFGAAINSKLGRMNVERLLQESQALTEELQLQSEELQTQSEELQVQQEQLRFTNDHLEEQNQLARIKTGELEQARDELEAYSEQLRRSSQFKSDFLANMSHELRTPLNSILILSQIMAENSKHTLNDEEEKYAIAINSAGKDLLSLIDDILDLSKVEAGKVDIVVTEMNVAEISTQMKQSFEHMARSKGIAFHIAVDKDVPAILATDGQRLHQIIKNLLSNAFKFTEQGTVAMTIKNAKRKRVKEMLPQHQGDNVLEIAISDTGIGIPEAKLQLIFEAFQQIDSTTNRRYGGTGLGLSICREFIRLLEGCITLQSEEQKGSTFTILVPNLQETEIHADDTGHKEAAAALVVPNEPAISVNALFASKKVLLVEDDPRNVYALANALESEGMVVKVAENGKECLRILEEDAQFDLILMDVMMPIMDGYEAMKAIRQDHRLKALPIIALTAKAMKKDQEKCLEAGASDYISKPLDMNQLFSLMRVWLIKQVNR